jgi:glucose dehydrogenase
MRVTNAISLGWTSPLTVATVNYAAQTEGVAYVGSFDGYLYALDATSGKEKWKFKVGSHGAVLAIDPGFCRVRVSPHQGENSIVLVLHCFFSLLEANSVSRLCSL